MTYAIVTDSNNQLAESVLKEDGIDVVPFPCSLGEKTYFDGVEITAAEFLEEMKRGSAHPRTAAPEPRMLEEIYRKRAKQGKTIISMHMSSGLSQATHEVVAQVKKKVPGAKVYVHDNMHACGGNGLQVHLTAIKVKAEKNIKPEQVLEYAAYLRKRTTMLACFPDLGYLYRGGRIGRARSLMGMLLKIMPIIQTRGEDNIISAYGKGRNLKQVNHLMVESVKRDLDKHKGEKVVFLASAQEDNAEALADLKDQLSSSGLPLEEVDSQVNTCLVVYGGPRSWFFAYAVI